MGWKKVTTPKDVGGLSIQAAKGRNTALLAKLNWRFHTEKDSQWAKVLRLKYCTNRRLISRDEARLPCSRTWRRMKKGEPVFKKGINWVPGYNSKLSFWHDNWTKAGILRNIIQGPLTTESNLLEVKDVASLEGWKWNLLQIEIPDEVKRVIQATPFSCVARNQDKLAWKPSPKGSFDLSSAYLLASEPLPDPVFQGKWIWKLDTLPRIKTFIWKCMHHSIGVRDCLQARGLQVDNICPHCHNRPESIIHALRDCHVLKTIWHQLGISCLDISFFSANMQDWLMSNCKDKGVRSSGQAPWNQIFMFAIWTIWKGRNQLVFENKNLKSSMAKDIFYQALEYFHCAGKLLVSIRKILKQVCWEKPCSGWLKLNTDGSVLGNPGLAGGGGVLRDEYGSWIGGFSRRIGIANSFTAELWALRDGLLLCRQLNVQAVAIELDASAIVDAFSHQSAANTIVSSILDDCKLLMNQIPQTSISHVYREANKSADWLASFGLNLDSNFVLWNGLPVDLIPILEADSRGLYSSRHCVVPGFAL